MKKTIAVVLTGAALLSVFTGCGKKEGEPDNRNMTSVSSSSSSGFKSAKNYTSKFEFCIEKQFKNTYYSRCLIHGHEPCLDIVHDHEHKDSRDCFHSDCNFTFYICDENGHILLNLDQYVRQFKDIDVVGNYVVLDRKMVLDFNGDVVYGSLDISAQTIQLYDCLDIGYLILKKPYESGKPEEVYAYNVETGKSFDFPNDTLHWKNNAGDNLRYLQNGLYAYNDNYNQNAIVDIKDGVKYRWNKDDLSEYRFDNFFNDYEEAPLIINQVWYSYYNHNGNDIFTLEYNLDTGKYQFSSLLQDVLGTLEIQSVREPALHGSTFTSKVKVQLQGDEYPKDYVLFYNLVTKEHFIAPESAQLLNIGPNGELLLKYEVKPEGSSKKQDYLRITKPDGSVISDFDGFLLSTSHSNNHFICSTGGNIVKMYSWDGTEVYSCEGIVVCSTDDYILIELGVYGKDETYCIFTPDGKAVPVYEGKKISTIEQYFSVNGYIACRDRYNSSFIFLPDGDIAVYSTEIPKI